MHKSDLLRSVENYILANNIRPDPYRLRETFNLYLRDSTIEDTRVLEIGAGTGINAVYASALGAARVVALEPESAGATSGVSQAFAKFAESVNLERRVDYRTCTFDQFSERYDGLRLILSLCRPLLIILMKVLPAAFIYLVLTRKEKDICPFLDECLI